MAVNKKGISIIELLVVTAIIFIGLIGLLSAATFSLKFSRLIKENETAKALAEEALEAVRNFRDGTTWDTNGLRILDLDPIVYHPEKIGTPPRWNLALGQETINGFTRKVIIKKVFRDANSDIALVGTEDANTKLVTATVSWSNRTVEVSTYLTNWK